MSAVCRLSSAVLLAHRWRVLSTVLSVPWFLSFRVVSGVPYSSLSARCCRLMSSLWSGLPCLLGPKPYHSAGGLLSCRLSCPSQNIVLRFRSRLMSMTGPHGSSPRNLARTRFSVSCILSAPSSMSGTCREPFGNLSDFLSAPPVSSQIVSRPRVVSTVLSAVLSAHRGGFVSTVLSAPWFLFFRVLSGVPLFSGFVSTILLHTLSDHHASCHSVTHPETLRLYAQACGLLLFLVGSQTLTDRHASLCHWPRRVGCRVGRHLGRGVSYLVGPLSGVPARVITPSAVSSHVVWYRMSCRLLPCQNTSSLLVSYRLFRRLSCRRTAEDLCLPSCRLRGFCFSVCFVGCPCPCSSPPRCVISCRLISDVLSAPPVSSQIVSRPRVVSTVLSAVLSAHRGGFVSTVLSAPWFLFFRVLSGVPLFSGFVSTILLHTLSDHHAS